MFIGAFPHRFSDDVLRCPRGVRARRVYILLLHLHLIFVFHRCPRVWLVFYIIIFFYSLKNYRVDLVNNGRPRRAFSPYTEQNNVQSYGLPNYQTKKFASHTKIEFSDVMCTVFKILPISKAGKLFHNGEEMQSSSGFFDQK